MNSKTKREVKDLERQKKKALEKNNFIEAAKVCNVIGELLSTNGLLEEAVDAHTEEINISEAADDGIGVAVGHRKVGECLCELSRFEDAIAHQKQHLKISKSRNNLLEEQRALATLGRTYFLQGAIYTDDEKKFNKCLVLSQNAYLQSLEICNKMHSSVPDNELMEMKARLYLNLGLTYEWKHDVPEALKFVNKALVISREQKLKADIYRCHFTLSGLYVIVKNYEKALQSAKSALTIAKDGNNKVQEMDALQQMGVALLRLGEFRSSLHALKKVYKSALKEKAKSDELTVTLLKHAMKGLQLHRQYDACDDKNNLLTICEKLGDFYHEIEAPERALEFYLQQYNVASALGLSGSSLATIYISIGVTYSDCKQYEEALEFYEKELVLRNGELKEKSSTYCAIAKCMEDLGRSLEDVKATYMKALQCAQGSGNRRHELKVYNDLSETLKYTGLHEEYGNVESKIRTIKAELELDDGEDGESDLGGTPGESPSSSQFNTEELQLLESDSEDEIDGDQEEAHLSTNKTSSSRIRQSRHKKKKVNKVNERGETPLHLAAIAGNVHNTCELLKQGADMNARDFCGWQPLHEACNHGTEDVVKLLLENGANVNDPGGAHCGGITPLHDASQNGHLGIVQLLITAGANVSAKTKEDFTALDLVLNAIKADTEEFTDSYAEENALLIERKKVAKYLKEILSSKNQQHQRSRSCLSANRNRMLLGTETDGSENEDEDDGELPFKRARTAKESGIMEDDDCQSLNDQCTPPSEGFVYHDHMCEDELMMHGDDEEESPLSPGMITNRNENSNTSSDLSQEHHFHLHEKEDFISNIHKQNDSRTTTSSNNSSSTNGRRPELGNLRSGKVQSTRTNKNPYTRVRQSKIGFTRSPSPSMFNENDTRLENFIVNDIPSKNKSNRNANKNNRQGRIDFESRPGGTDTAASASHTSKRKSPRKNQHSSKRKWRQQPIGPFTEVCVNSESESVHVSSDDDVGDANGDTPTVDRASALFRVKVRIAEQCHLIACQQTNELNVEWLTKQAVERYYATSNVSAKLALKTKDNALLNPNDVIADVIMNNEELVGEIVGFQFPPLLERYATNCERCQTEPLLEMLEHFSLDDDLVSFCMKDVYVNAKDIQAVFCSLICSTSLTSIDLSGTYIGDQNFTTLQSALKSLPNISSLNLSTTGISVKSLLSMSKIASSQPKEDYKFILKASPLSTLKMLNVSFNDLGDEEMFPAAMTTILKKCTQLDSLSFSSCKLKSSMFTRRQLKDAIRGSSIKKLDLSCNELGTWCEIVEVISLFNTLCLECLQLSSTTSGERLQGNIDLYSLTRLFENGKSLLQELRLDQMPRLVFTGNSWFAPGATTIQSLSMRFQLGSHETIQSLIREVSQLKHLRVLDFSFTKTLDETHFDGLLTNLKTNNSQVENISLVSCHICSRLPCTLFETLRHWRATCRLKRIDLSFNEISLDDKRKLKESWQMNRKTMTDCDMQFKKLLLFCNS